jgi:hypothetical protein
MRRGQMGDGREISEAERAVVSELLDSAAVNFDVIGKALTTHGPELARQGASGASIEPWEVFCATMRYYVRVYRLPPVFEGLEELSKLKQVGGELHG